MGNSPEMQKVHKRKADCSINVTKATREALVALKAEMRKRLGRLVSYDEMIQILLAEYIVPADKKEGE